MESRGSGCWYIANGEQKALEYGTLADIGAQTATAVIKVSWQHVIVMLTAFQFDR